MNQTALKIDNVEDMALTIVKKDSLNKEVVSIVDEAKVLIITDSQSYTIAGEFWKSIKELRKKIAATFDHHIKKAHEIHKGLIADKKKDDDPLDDAERIIKRKMADYDQEQKRIRREEQRRLEEEAIKAEEERLLAEAIAVEEAAKAAGASQDEAQAEAEQIINQPVYVPPIVVPKATPKMHGGPVFREIWSAQIVDIRSLCRAVADGKASPECVMGNMPVLNRMAGALKSTLNIPGVKAVSRRV